jgi:hypothetical protein
MEQWRKEHVGSSSRASPGRGWRCGDRVMVAKKWWWWRSVRAVLDRGNNRKIVEGGAVDDDGALPFYRGRGGGWEWHMTVVNECLLGCRYLE